MKLSEKIKLIRKIEGYSQKEMSDKLNIGLSTLGHYEGERREPSNNVIEKLSNIHPEYAYWLLTSKTDPPNHIDPLIKQETKTNVSIEKIGDISNNSGDVNIGSNVNKTTNIIESNISDKKSFIDDKLKNNIKKLHKDIYEIREVEEPEDKKNYFIWQRLNSYMGVNKYHHIKKEEYETAERFLKDWIQNWKDAPEHIKKLRKKIFDIEKNSNEYFNFLKKEFNTIYLKDLIKDELVYIVDFLENQNSGK